MSHGPEAFHQIVHGKFTCGVAQTIECHLICQIYADASVPLDDIACDDIAHVGLEHLDPTTMAERLDPREPALDEKPVKYPSRVVLSCGEAAPARASSGEGTPT